MSLLTVAAAVSAAKAIHAGDTPASTANYGRGRGVGRARGAGVTLGAGVGVAVGVGVGVAHGVNVYVARLVLRRWIRPTNAEVLSVNSQVAFPLDTRHPRAFGVERWSEHAKDHVEPPVWIVLIQAHLKILRRRVIPIEYCAPFDVKDAVRRAACD